MSSLLEESVPVRAQEVEVRGPHIISFGRDICGKHTDLVVSKYFNRTLVVLTQLRKLGTVLEVSRDAVRNPTEGSSGRTVFSVRTLLGQASEEVDLLARMLAERIDLTNPLVLTVGVKDLDVPTVKALVTFVAENF